MFSVFFVVGTFWIALVVGKLFVFFGFGLISFKTEKMFLALLIIGFAWLYKGIIWFAMFNVLEIPDKTFEMDNPLEEVFGNI